MKKALLSLILCIGLLLSGCDYFIQPIDKQDEVDEVDDLDEIKDVIDFELNEDEIIIEINADLYDLTEAINLSNHPEAQAILDTLVFDETELDLSTLGTYTVPYTFTGSDEVVYSDEITVLVVDTTPPVITMNGEPDITHELYNLYFDESASIMDNSNEQIDLVVSTDYNPFISGSYSIVYSAVDSSGNSAEKTRTIVVGKKDVTDASEFGLFKLDNMEHFTKALTLSNGDIIISGNAHGIGKVIRLTSDGSVVWVKDYTMDQAYDAIVEDFIIDNNNHIIAVGWYNLDNRAGFISALDMDGNEILEYTADSSENNMYQGVMQRADGSYIVAISESFSAFRVVNLDSSFNEIWNSRFSGELWYKAMTEHTDGSIDILSNQAWSSTVTKLSINTTGTLINQTYSNAGSSIRTVLIEDDRYIIGSSAGLTIWDESTTHNVSILHEDYAVLVSDISPLPGGYYVVVGEYETPSKSREAISLILDEDFTIVQRHSLSGSDQDYMGVVTTSGDKILAFGSSSSTNGDYEDMDWMWGGCFFYSIPIDTSVIIPEIQDPPTMDMIGKNVLNLEVGSTFVDQGVLAYNDEGNIPVTVFHNVDTSTPGMYSVYYVAENKTGRNFLRRTVHVYEQLTPETTYYFDIYSLINEHEELYEFVIQYDYNNDAFISENELQHITSYSNRSFHYPTLSFVLELPYLEYLTLSGSDELDITGIETLVHLEELDLSGNSIVNLHHINQLVSLKELNLNNNLLSDLSPLATMTNLTALFLSNNMITDVDSLGTLPNLQRLYLSRNQISAFNTVSRFPQLKELDLSYNGLSTVNGFNNPELIDLRITDTTLTNLDGFEGLIHSLLLNELHLSQNDLNDVCGIANVTTIEYLYLATNQITDISCLSPLVNLKHLGLVNNEISDITVLTNFVNLERFELSHTNGSLAPVLELTNLNSVYLTLNQYDLTINSEDRLIIEQIWNAVPNPYAEDILSLGSLDSGLISILEPYDTNNTYGLDILEIRSIVSLDLSTHEITNLSALQYFQYLETVTINTTYTDISTSTNSNVIDILTAAEVTILYVE
jgi:hypothetical protein